MRTFFMTTERLGFSRWTDGDAVLADLLWGDAEVEASEGGVRITPKFDGDGAVIVRVR